MAQRGIELDVLLAAMEAIEPLAGNADLLSFGPHFGREALDQVSARLTKLGLIYFDDFFEFSGDYPKWCRFRAEVRRAD